jgi:hypothetical protein
MASLYPQKMTVEMEGDFVVFLIGMRINRPWKVHKWLPVFLAMPRMVRELRANPEIGCLGVNMSPGVIVQYWRSFDHLEAYARSRNHLHLPAWRAFNRRVSYGSGDVGIWHETYKVAAGQYEAVYGNMPAYGLGAAGRLVPAANRRETARGRLDGGAEDSGFRI